MKINLLLPLLIFAIYCGPIDAQNIFAEYANQSNTFTIETIGNARDRISQPRDLDFNPLTGDLWIINQGTESSGGSTVIIMNPGQNDQTSIYRKDQNSWHFMSLPSGIAFGLNGNFATSTSVFDANHRGRATGFTGPSLWPSDLGVYAQPSGGNGSHIDMLHESPYCMGIAAEFENVYWVTDMNNHDIVRYDFAEDHGPGNADHDDGKVLRYTGFPINWVSQSVSSHLILDEIYKWLYFTDSGNRVVRLDINSGQIGGAPNYGPFERLAQYANVDGATWEVVTDVNLEKACGIAISGNHLAVSDNATGEIIIYDVSTLPATELNRIKTLSGIQGITVGPDGRLWFVNSLRSMVGRIEIDQLSKVDNVISDPSFIHVAPNPNLGQFEVTIDGLSENANAELMNLNGQIVFSKTISVSNKSINTTHLQSGTYFLNITNDKYNLVKKIVIR